MAEVRGSLHPILGTTITIERLNQRGYNSFLEFSLKIRWWCSNRRIRGPGVYPERSRRVRLPSFISFRRINVRGALRQSLLAEPPTRLQVVCSLFTSQILFNPSLIHQVLAVFRPLNILVSHSLNSDYRLKIGKVQNVICASSTFTRIR